MDKPARAVPKDIAGFTVLRGLAAWWVVLYHVRDHFLIYWPDWFSLFASKGYLAVDFFFLLSGFVIQLNYGHSLGARPQQLLGFWVKRLARIYPLHLLTLFLVILYSAALVTSGRPLTANYNISHLWMQALLIHNWGFTSHLAWNVPSWSISTEWGAYLFFPLWSLCGQWQKRSSGTVIMMLALLVSGLYFLFAGNGYTQLGQNIMQLGIWRCIMQFAMGSLLCILWQRHGHARKPLYLVTITMVTTGLLALIFSLPEIMWLPLFWGLWLFIVASLWALMPSGPVLRVFIVLGDASYATYLLHYVLFIYWKALFWTANTVTPLWHLYAYGATLLLLSVLTYYYFEKPAQRFVQSLWFGQKPLPQASKKVERAPW